LIHSSRDDRAINRLRGRRRRGGHPEHRSAHRALPDVHGRVRANAALSPSVERAPDLDRPAAVVVRDDGRDALHEIREVGVSLRRRQVRLRVRMRIDESRGDDQPRRVDRSRRRDTTRRGVADERDSIAGDADIDAPPWRPALSTTVPPRIKMSTRCARKQRRQEHPSAAMPR
jgi:hypothetical protein